MDQRNDRHETELLGGAEFRVATCLHRLCTCVGWAGGGGFGPMTQKKRSVTDRSGDEVGGLGPAVLPSGAGAREGLRGLSYEEGAAALRPAAVGVVQAHVGGASGPAVQLTADVGMAKETSVEGYVNTVGTSITAGRDEGVSGDAEEAAEDYVTTLLGEVNNRLLALGCARGLTWNQDGEAKDKSAAFQWAVDAWEIRLAKAYVAAQITGMRSGSGEAEEKLKRAATTIYHEGRHAEQMFRAARCRVGKIKPSDAT